MYAIYDYSSDADASFVIGVVSTQALAKKAIRYLKANNPYGYSEDYPCFKELELDWVTVKPGWDEEKIYVPEAVCPSAYFTASFGSQGEIRLRQISEPKEFVLEMSNAVWRHNAYWGEKGGVYGSLHEGEIKCIQAETEEEALEKAEQARQNTAGKAPAFFIHRIGIFLVTDLQIVRATTQVFGSHDEAHFYGKKEVPGYGIDQRFKILSYAEAGRLYARMKKSEKIREKNINLLMTGKLPGQPVLAGASVGCVDAEHF